MKLYLKKYNEEPVDMSKAFIMDDTMIQSMKNLYPGYPEPYCWEVDIINRIAENEDSYFDFSKNFIDIGAGCGEYCSTLNFKNNYIFEPCREIMWICHANLVNNHKVKNSHTYEVALSDSNDEIQIFTNGTQEYTNVESRTLDSFNIPNVGFIKIDVEGFEESVIRGGLLTITGNDYPPILFECWDVGEWNMTQEKRDSLFNLLRTLGYEILERWGDWETHLAVHKSHMSTD